VLTEADLNNLEKHLIFSSFEKNEAVNYENLKLVGAMNPDGGKFIRKGCI